MKIYFQDLNMDAQEEVWGEVRERLRFDKGGAADNEDDGDEEEWIDEEVDDYINRHNFGVEFSMTD